MKPTYTNSSLNCFRRCTKEYEFRYVKLRRTKSIAPALKFGRLMHVGLNNWWENEEDKVGCAILSMAKLQSTPVEEVKCQELMRGYDARWGNEKFQGISVENRVN